MHIFPFSKWSVKNRVYFVLDGLINAFLVTPLTVALWWSVWGLLDDFAATMHINDIAPNLGYWILLEGGTISELIVYLFQHRLRTYMSSNQRSKTVIRIVTRVQLYIMFILSMSVWVGGWTLLDNLTGCNDRSALVCLVISILGLFILRNLNGGVSVPMHLQLDSQQSPFNHSTRFMVNPCSHNGSRTRQCFIYFLDCIATNVIIPYLIIAYWRGAFIILDLYFLPNDRALSYFITITIGFTMFAVLLIFQFPAVHVARNTSPWKRLLWESLYWTVAFIMMLCIWYGEWNAIIFYAAVEMLDRPYRYVVPLLAHVVIVTVMMALDIFGNGTTGSLEVIGANQNGTGLLINNYICSVSNLMAAYGLHDDESKGLTRKQQYEHFRGMADCEHLAEYCFQGFQGLTLLNIPTPNTALLLCPPFSQKAKA